MKDKVLFGVVFSFSICARLAQSIVMCSWMCVIRKTNLRVEVFRIVYKTVTISHETPYMFWLNLRGSGEYWKIKLSAQIYQRFHSKFSPTQWRRNLFFDSPVKYALKFHASWSLDNIPLPPRLLSWVLRYFTHINPSGESTSCWTGPNLYSLWITTDDLFWIWIVTFG